MQKIINVREYNCDCSSNHFYFINDDAVVCFYQALNHDLIFSAHTFNGSDKVTFLITKDEFSEVYDLIDAMLTQIHSRKDVYGYNELFEKGHFYWQSDAPANDWAGNDGFIYNYISIIPTESAYKLEFINNTNFPYFSVEVNTDRSRYGSIGFAICTFYKELANVCSEEDKTIINKHFRQLSRLRKRDNPFS